MSTELDSQLSDYFAWVEQQASCTLHRTTDVDLADDQRPRRHRLLVVACLIVAAIVAGIGLLVRHPGDDPSPPVSPTELNERFQRVERRVVAVYGSFFDQQLTEWETSHQIGLEIQQCLATRAIDSTLLVLPAPPDRGIDFRRTQEQWWAWPDEALAERSGYGLVMVPTGFVRDTGEPDPERLARLAPADRSAFEAALSSCPPPGCCDTHPTFQLALEVVLPLDARLDDAFDAPSFSGPRRTYQACIRRAGYDFDRPGEAFDSVLEGAIGDLGWPTDPSHANYEQALDVERSVAVADVHCRLEIESELLSLVENAVDEWQAADADRIAETTQAWIDLRARAYGEIE